MGFGRMEKSVGGLRLAFLLWAGPAISSQGGGTRNEEPASSHTQPWVPQPVAWTGLYAGRVPICPVIIFPQNS